MTADSNKFVLIDGHAMLYRAWFAFPKTLTKRDGTLLNAVYGFTRILLNVIHELKPEYLVVSFDVGRTFRHDMFAEYKAHREKMPDELKEQEPITNDVVRALNIPIFTMDGFEADDVIGTLATQASALRDGELVQTMIVTGDKDSLQLVNDEGRVRVYMPARANKAAVIYDEAGVVVDMGLRAAQIPDYKGLAGDQSDNIPGIRGIGPKTACQLLERFGSVEGIYASIDKKNSAEEIGLLKDLKQAVLDKLKLGRASAFESKRLATIITDVPIKLDLEAARVRGYDKATTVNLFKELEFTSLVSKLPGDAFEATVQEALF